MARKTVYTLYKTGRVDPTLTHIWGFELPNDRATWLYSKPHLTFTDNKYWRVGSTIKIPVSYETSFEYDYVQINNDSGTSNERVWYAFISARAYISPSVTLLTLDTDYIQTFYFDGFVPFWNVPGFIVKSTAQMPPIPGTPSDFPVPQPKTLAFSYESGSYAFVIYSTIDPSTVSTTPAYYGAIIDGVYNAACPYVIGGSNAQTLVQAVNDLISAFNAAGLTDAIVSIYAVPSRYFKAAVLDNTPHRIDSSSTQQIITTVGLDSESGLECAYLLDNYDYTYIVVNNGQGETAVFRGYEFSGNPQFALDISFTAGCPTLYLTPINLRYGATGANQTYTMKITQSISCSFLNDSYRIWLAQTQNSRAAAIAGAELAISQAEEARSRSWAYQFGGIVERTEQQIRDPFTGALADLVGSTGELFGADMGNTGISSVGRNFSKSDTGIDVLDAPVHTYGSRYRELQSGMQMGYDLLTRYINHQLGIETRYTYDHAVANAQQSLNVLMASYKDKARVPATARGSNAYGDMAHYKQYGFMIGVYGPSPECYTLLNDMLRASGHTINRYGLIAKTHWCFDYYQVNSARIPVNTSVRPEFVRKMMLDLLQKGVYLWYIDDGDISPYFGTPFGIENDEVGNG